MRYNQIETMLKNKQIYVSWLDCTIYDLCLDGIHKMDEAEKAAAIAVQNLLDDGYVIVRDEFGVEYVEKA